MGPTVIGVDPHKRSHTAVVLDEHEEIAAQLRVAADRRQLERLLGWASDWPERIWAVENVNGLGRLLSQQLVLAGERVVDVPASLAHRTRKLSGKSGRKTDEHDARSVAITAAHPGRLRTVELEDFSQALELILDRRWHLVSFRHRTICRLHALLAEMIPGGAPKKLTTVKAAKLLRSVRPATLVEAERREMAKQLLDDWRWCNRRIPAVEARCTKRCKRTARRSPTSSGSVTSAPPPSWRSWGTSAGSLRPGTSPPTTAPLRSRRPRATSSGTVSTRAATADSTPLSISPRSPRSATPPPVRSSSAASSPRARARRKRCGRSSGSSPT
jgi:hypothetical protein